MQRKDPVPDCLIMVRPTDFGFNAETFVDNVFQKASKDTNEEILKKAQKEFDDYVSLLREKGVKVIVLDKALIPELREVKMPDDVFPNWFSTEPNGLLITYKMMTQLRENEKQLLKYLRRALYEEGYQVSGELNIGSDYDPPEYCLEGTGAMVFDRKNKVIFSGRSKRSHPKYFEKACEILGYKGIMYETEMSNGEPLYHSDLYFCLGQEFAVICLEAIKMPGRERVKDQLTKMGKEIIELSLEQVEKNFCGNILEIQSQVDGKKYIIMSKNALKGYNEDQLSRISKYGEILAVSIDTIEEVGGGSAKCMLTECLLPQREDFKSDGISVNSPSKS